jgi:hypothetical protein
MTLTASQRAEVQAMVDAGVQAAVNEALRRGELVRKQDGTIIDVDGRFCTVQLAGSGEDELVECIRTWSTQAVDDEVLVLYVPPSGAIAIGRLPAPTEPGT